MIFAKSTGFSVAKMKRLEGKSNFIVKYGKGTKKETWQGFTAADLWLQWGCQVAVQSVFDGLTESM